MKTRTVKKSQCVSGVGREVLVGGQRVKEGDKGDDLWLMGFVCLYETELKKPLEIAFSGVRSRLRGMMMREMYTLYNISLIGIITLNPTHIRNIS
jgi:hypothetical protein